MIENAFVYTKADIALIKLVKEEKGGYTADMWFDGRLDELKGRIKQHYLLEQDNRCCYCNQQIGINHGRNWDTEHVVPRSLRPNFVMETLNLAVACVECDGNKSDHMTTTSTSHSRYSKKSNSYIICHPHYDNLLEHIQIFQQYVYLSKSLKGRKTIEFCGIARYYERFGLHVDLTADEIDDLMRACLYETDPTLKELRTAEMLIIVQQAFIWRRRRR